MFFKDLSSADHDGSYQMERALHVGWLEPSEEAPTTGVAPEGFLERLKQICVYDNNAEAHRGFHACPFCEKSVGSTTFLIRSVGGDVRYYVPSLITHYVSEHEYLPPKEFIDAVMAFSVNRLERKLKRRRRRRRSWPEREGESC